MSTTPRRRTQEERREATRTALLDATVACLVEHGYAGTTTARVADLAGVSRGAQVHYFASKAALVAAAVDHLAQRRIDEFDVRIRAIPAGRRRFEAMLDLLWDAHQDDIFDATLELWVASRTDPELLPHLVELERTVALAIAKQSAATLGDLAARPGFRDDVELALATARGLALLRIARPDDVQGMQQRWKAARTRLLKVLAP